jgi:hypothetical protein
MATVNGLTFCSSILPWRACGADPPWIGTRHQEKTENAINSLMGNLPRERLVWGGDWNHALTGREYAGSMGGRRAILAAVDDRDLQVPTSGLGHRIDGLLTIDHIALDSATAVMSADRIVAQDLSDHDAYVVEIG